MSEIQIQWGGRWYREEYIERMKVYNKLHSRELRAHYKKVLRRYKQMKGCCYCNIKNPIVLEFHHLKKRNGDITTMIWQNLNCRNKLRKIIKECIVVCANHHKIIEAERGEEDEV